MGKSSICEIQWLDVHSDNQKVAEVGADLEYVRERLHAVDANGNVQVGFNAFLAIWRNSPNETWKSRLLGLPLIKPLCEVSYNLFAAALYKWNKAKSTGSGYFSAGTRAVNRRQKSWQSESVSNS